MAYFFTLAAVLRTSLKAREYFQASIMGLGFISCGILFYCCWIDLGGNAWDRIINLSPMFISAVVGFGLYRMKLLNMN